MAFDESTLESFLWESTARAAHAVASNLAFPPEVRLPVRGIKPLARSKCRCRRRGTPPRRDAGCGSQWRLLRLLICVPAPHPPDCVSQWRCPRLRACGPPRILGGVDIWRIDGLLTRKLYRKADVIIGFDDTHRCRRNVNPKRYPALENANTSISEQRFRLRAHFATLVRNINEQRFKLTCFMICRARTGTLTSARMCLELTCNVCGKLRLIASLRDVVMGRFSEEFNKVDISNVLTF